MIDNIFQWFRTLGGVCDQEGKVQFSTVFHELQKGDPSQEMKDSLNITEDILPLDGAYAFPLPTDMDVFSYKLSIGTKCEWLKWEDDIDTAAPLPRDIFACQVWSISKVCLWNFVMIEITAYHSYWRNCKVLLFDEALGWEQQTFPSNWSFWNRQISVCQRFTEQNPWQG